MGDAIPLLVRERVPAAQEISDRVQLGLRWHRPIEPHRL
jgi:hypothetical protein